MGRAVPAEWRELRDGLASLWPTAQLAGDAASTRERLAAGSPLLRDAVFEHAGARVQLDLLERLPEGNWRALLLVADERIRDADRERAGLAHFALQGSGLRVGRIELWLPDRARARGSGAIDWTDFFRSADVTRDAVLLARDAAGDLARLHGVLAAGQPPRVEPSPHCLRPTRCPQRGGCTRALEPGWIGNLPRLRPALHHALRERGVERIADIPDDIVLGPEQRAARAAARAGKSWRSPGLAAALAKLGPPAAFLDFEAIAPALPLYPGTRPFQVIPMQWSLRVVDTGGRVLEREFLAEPGSDPRPALVDALLESAGPPELPLVVYSSFEAEVLAELAEALPGRAERLLRLRARLRDLQVVVRAHAYHVDQAGAYGLKRVLPAWIPSSGWDDLEIHSGAGAAEAWLALARGELEPAAAASARSALARYCSRDTVALDALLRALREPH